MSATREWKDVKPKKLAELLGLIARYHVLRERQAETMGEMERAVLHHLGYRRFKTEPLLVPSRRKKTPPFLWVPPGSREFMTAQEMHKYGLTKDEAVAAAMEEFGIGATKGEDDS